MYDQNQEGADDPFEQKLEEELPDDEEEESILTKSEDRIYTESVKSTEEDYGEFCDMDLDHGNTISSIKMDKFRV